MLKCETWPSASDWPRQTQQFGIVIPDISEGAALGVTFGRISSARIAFAVCRISRSVVTVPQTSQAVVGTAIALARADISVPGAPCRYCRFPFFLLYVVGYSRLIERSGPEPWRGSVSGVSLRFLAIVPVWRVSPQELLGFFRRQRLQNDRLLGRLRVIGFRLAWLLDHGLTYMPPAPQIQVTASRRVEAEGRQALTISKARRG